MESPQVSVVICTHNRDTYLGDAIESVLQQKFSDFELLVVDNASSDRTREVVDGYLSDARVRYIYEPTLGLNVARNTGARETSAPVLVYFDDDAVAGPLWLGAVHGAFQANPQLGVAGGKVTLIWPEGFSAPQWLSPGLATNLGAYDLGDEMIHIDNPSFTPRGLNYSIRRSVLIELGGFHLNLDRVGKNLLSNGELYMTELVLKQGYQVAYLPAAAVGHRVSPERTKQSWFLQRGWWQGISECYREQISGRTVGPSQIAAAGERFARGLYKSVKHMGDPALRFDNFVYAYGQIGYISAVLQRMIKGPTLAK